MNDTLGLKALARSILARHSKLDWAPISAKDQTRPSNAGVPASILNTSIPVADLTATSPWFRRVAAGADDEPGLETPCEARRGRVQSLDKMFLHFCVQCGAYGPFGYGVNMRAGHLGRWYCRKHRPLQRQ